MYKKLVNTSLDMKQTDDDPDAWQDISVMMSKLKEKKQGVEATLDLYR